MVFVTIVMDIHPGWMVLLLTFARGWEENTSFMDCVAGNRKIIENQIHSQFDSLDHVSTKTPSYAVYGWQSTDGSLLVTIYGWL